LSSFTYYITRNLNHQNNVRWYKFQAHVRREKVPSLAGIYLIDFVCMMCGRLAAGRIGSCDVLLLLNKERWRVYK